MSKQIVPPANQAQGAPPQTGQPAPSGSGYVPPPASTPPAGKSLQLDLSQWHRYITLTAQLGLEKGSVIETNAGLKLKIVYQSGTVAYFPRSKGSAPQMIEGVVLSGADWITARSDGVLTFDSRVTLQFHTPTAAGTTEDYLIDATFRGVLDLGFGTSLKDDAEIFSKYQRGVGLNPTSVSLSARFEGSAGPAPNDDTSWLPAHLKASVNQFTTFRDLMRQQFFAEGTLQVQPDPYFPPTEITLHVWGQP